MAACHKRKKSKRVQNTHIKPPPESNYSNNTHSNLKKGTIVGMASQHKNLSKLVKALETSGLARKLTDNGPFTLFAPNNKAFMAIPEGRRNILLNQKQQKLAKILAYHVVKGDLKKSDLTNGKMLKTLNGKKLKVTRKNGTIMINDAKILEANIKASNGNIIEANNGTIFIINKVLMPSKTTNK